MMEKKAARTPGSGRDLVLTRDFDAPRRLVWQAWTEPDRFKLWWGPKDFTSPACQIDLRIGGRYLFCMRSPEGQEYWSTGVYTEIVPLERLVYTDSFSDPKGNVVPASYYGMEGSLPLEFRVTVVLEDLDGGRTRMTLTHEGLPEGFMQDQTGEGWSGSFDKLAESLT